MSARKKEIRKMDREAMRVHILKLEKELGEVRTQLASGFTIPEGTVWMLDVAELFIGVCKILSEKINLPIETKAP